MNAEEFLRFHVEKIIKENELQAKFKLFFPNIKYDPDIIPKRNGHETLKIKEVEGIGKFFYYSTRGKITFHEYILDTICAELRKQQIRYTRNKKISADLKIKGYSIELEIRSNPPKQPERRDDLIRRIKKNPDKTILILLNQKDKKAYLNSPAREIITGNNRFFTIREFLQKIRYLQDHIF